MFIYSTLKNRTLYSLIKVYADEVDLNKICQSNKMKIVNNYKL